MKSLLLFSLLITAASTTVYAQRLLNCNPPDGSRLQEIQITQVGNKIYRAELNFSGSYSAPVLISSAAWAKKDLHWRSEVAGNIHLRQVKEEGNFYWLFESNNFGSSSVGYCEE